MEDRQANVQWNKGRINWYDPESKHGSIIGDDGNWYRIHEFTQGNGDLTVSLTPDQRIEYQLALSSVHPIIERIRVISNEQAALDRWLNIMGVINSWIQHAELSGFKSSADAFRRLLENSKEEYFKLKAELDKT